MLTDQLLEEIEAGQAETLTVAARRIPPARQGRPVTLSCLFRWITHGVRGPGGQRIKLEAARLAGKWVTTPGAIRRFVQTQTPNSSGDTLVIAARRRPAGRLRASAKAAVELEKRGI